MSASCALHTGSPFSLPSAASWLSGKCRLRIERLTRNIRILSLLSNKIQYVKLGKFATTVQVRRYSLQLFIYSSNIFLSRVTLRYREKTDLTPSPGRRLYFEVPLRAHISSNVGHRSPHPPCEGSAIVEGEVADAGFIFVPSSFFVGDGSGADDTVRTTRELGPVHPYATVRPSPSAQHQGSPGSQTLALSFPSPHSVCQS